MRILNKVELVTFTVDADQWYEKLEQYGEEAAAKFLNAEWEYDGWAEDLFGEHITVSFSRQRTRTYV